MEAIKTITDPKELSNLSIDDVVKINMELPTMLEVGDPPKVKICEKVKIIRDFDSSCDDCVFYDCDCKEIPCIQAFDEVIFKKVYKNRII